MNVTLAQLAAFVHLAEERNFGAAARLGGISQPAMSRTIQTLEEAVGRRLFDRTTRLVELTPAGAELHPIAKRLQGDFQDAFRAFEGFIAGQRGKVTVATLPSIAAWPLPPAIARFLQEVGPVEFEIRDNLSEGVISAVLNGLADFGLSVRPVPVENLRFRRLLADRFGLVCRRDDELASRPSAPWSIFAQRPFIAMAPASSVRAMTDAAFLQAGVAIKPLYDCAYLGTTGGLVAAGLGITALPRLTLPLLGAADLVWRPLVHPILDRSIGILTRAGRTISPAAERFMKVLTQETKRSAATSGLAG